MKTEKDVWGNPIMNVQLFVPQDCVAACSRITNIYLDLNKNGESKYIDILNSRLQ